MRVCVSSFRRSDPNAWMLRVKGTGNYVNSYLGLREAVRNGYGDAIFLDPHGHVAEASTSNVFVAQDGELVTPPLDYALDGITRDTVIRLARQLGIVVHERRFGRDELATADEVMLTGTAAGIKTVVEIDGLCIGEGSVGPLTKRLRVAYEEAVAGRVSDARSWLTLV